MKFGAKLKNLRLSFDMSQEEFARKLGTTKQVISRYETEQRTPKITVARDYAEILGIDVNELVDDSIDLVNSSKALRIPVLGKVAAGVPMTAAENIIDWEEIPASWAADAEYIALQIKGRSMEPRIMEGDVIIVKVTPEAESGDIAVVMVNGDEATVKRIKLRPEGLLLIPNNPEFETMFYSNEEIESLPVKIFGKVVELRGKM